MGKSTAATLLIELGLPVIDTDVIARQLTQPGQQALSEIQRAFGPDVIRSEGHLDRQNLGLRVFGDPEARQRLETILHPRIRVIWQGQVAQWREEGRPTAVVVIPL